MASPLVDPGPALTREEVARYARHVLLPEIGMPGQRRLKNAHVLVVGAGGLGSPVLTYLAAAGVGTIGIADTDVVEASNLQRQVVHGSGDVGRRKTDSAAESLARVNPLVQVHRHDVRVGAATALDLLADYDVVVDGTDNFPTRYLLSDACVLLGIPCVWGSVYRFDGQVSVWWPGGGGPCYRCVFPQQPPAGAVPSCAEGGVLGVLCGAIGTVQATEVVKLVTGVGTPLVGRLLVHDALQQTWDSLVVQRDPYCVVCGDEPTMTRLADEQPLCAVPPALSAPTTAQGPADVLGEGPGQVSVEVSGEVSARELALLLTAAQDAAEDAAEDAPRDTENRPAGREAPVVLVDVRSEQERDISAIPTARWLPMEDFRSGAALARLPFDRPVVLHCRTGARSAEARDLLAAAGHRDVRSLRGGILAWAREVDPSLPVY